MSAPGNTVSPEPVSRLGSALFRLGRARRDAVASVLARRGWSSAVLPYPGYGLGGSTRVLARIVLAPARRQPSEVRGVTAWHRLVTLQRSRVDVDITAEGQTEEHRVRSGPGGFVDAALPWTLEPGERTVVLRVGRRPPVEATVHVAAPGARTGIVCDIDDTALVTGLQHPVRAAWQTMSRAFAQRVAVDGMADLVTAAHVQLGGTGTPVVYLSTGPWNFNGPLARFLARCGFPAGPLLLTQWGPTPEGVFRDGRVHKRRSLQRLRADFPDVRWLLVGDDGEHDPATYEEFAREHPEHVVAIALRQVGVSATPTGAEEDAPVPVVRGADGHVLLERLRPVLAEHLLRSGGGTAPR